MARESPTTRQWFDGTRREEDLFQKSTVSVRPGAQFIIIMLCRLVVMTLALIFLGLQVETAKSPRSIPKYTDWRLPRWLLPRHYKLRLLPFLQDGNFTTEGQVEILLECMEPTQLIVLHMAEMSIVPEGLQVSH